MSPDREQLEEEEQQIAAAVTELYLSEKIRFRWACIFCGLASLALLGGRLLVSITQKEISRLRLPADHERYLEIMALRAQVGGWLDITFFAGLLLFLASLFAWFAAMELRRRTLVRLALRQRGQPDFPPSA